MINDFFLICCATHVIVSVKYYANHYKTVQTNFDCIKIQNTNIPRDTTIKHKSTDIVKSIQ